MSGHSKWSTIKHQKAVTDNKRGQIFTKIANQIIIAVKEGGKIADPAANFRLRLVIEKAKSVNMPKDNIERAIAKGVSKDAGNLEQVVYEAYGPGGVAILIDALTDSKNRTTQEIKHLLVLQGVELASPGAASWAFMKTGTVYTPNEPLVEISGDDESRLSTILEALDEYDDVQQVFTNARGYENTGD